MILLYMVVCLCGYGSQIMDRFLLITQEYFDARQFSKFRRPASFCAAVNCTTAGNVMRRVWKAHVIIAVVRCLSGNQDSSVANRAFR